MKLLAWQAFLLIFIGWIFGIWCVLMASQFIDTYWMTRDLLKRGSRKGEEGETNG